MLSHQVLTNLLILTLSTKGSVSITILTNNKNLLAEGLLLPYLLILTHGNYQRSVSISTPFFSQEKRGIYSHPFFSQRKKGNTILASVSSVI